MSKRKIFKSTGPYEVSYKTILLAKNEEGLIKTSVQDIMHEMLKLKKQFLVSFL
jgi:hypothetical protein